MGKDSYEEAIDALKKLLRFANETHVHNLFLFQFM